MKLFSSQFRWRRKGGNFVIDLAGEATSGGNGSGFRPDLDPQEQGVTSLMKNEKELETKPTIPPPRTPANTNSYKLKVYRYVSNCENF